MNNITQYYKILGLDITSSISEVKTAYRSLAKKWHPDRFISQPEQLQQAEKEIQKINQAYEIIKLHIQNINNNTNTKSQIKTQKSDVSYHYELGVQLAEQEDYQSAINEFSRVIKLDQNYLKAYQYRGFLLSKLGYENRANSDFLIVKKLKHNFQYQSSASTSSQKKSHTSNYKNHSYPKNKTHSNQENCNINYNNFHSRKCLNTILGHNKAISSILVSNDNQTLFTSSYDKSIKIWELKTGKIIDTLRLHSEAVTCLTLSHDNQILISGSKDKTICFWNLKQKKVIKTLGGWFKGHSKAIISIVLDPENNNLISASLDNTIKIWNLRENKEIKQINCKSRQITSLAIGNRSGLFCNSGLEKQIRLRNTKGGSIIRSLRGDSGVTALTFSHNEKLLATGEISRQIKIFDLETGKIIKKLKGHQDRISSLIFSPDNKKIISCSWDKTIKVWDIEKQIEQETLTGHSNRVLSLAMTSDGKTVISGSKNGKIKFWKL